MPKFSKGDIAIITDHCGEGTIVQIENWRGGRVAPYVVRVLESASGTYQVGAIAYKSGRDMEHKEMQGKKKVYCCHSGCSIYSFESKGTLQWECFKHSGEYQGCETANGISLEEKVDLILDHLGLDVVIEPRKAVLTERAEDPEEDDG